VAELPEDALVLGPAAASERYTAALPPSARLPDDPSAHWPDPHRLWRSGRRDEIWFLEPVYLRRSAAEEQWERKSAPG
jgi:tRNA threonylcarbamoyladenosine biosynthesis protein TsaB